MVALTTYGVSSESRSGALLKVIDHLRYVASGADDPNPLSTITPIRFSKTTIKSTLNNPVKTSDSVASPIVMEEPSGIAKSNRTEARSGIVLAAV